MPLEGHWTRVNTPLRKLTRRERNVAIVTSVLTLVVVLVLVLATVGDSRPAPAPGCIYAIVPGVMGATAVDACGAQAKKTCAQHADPALTDPVSVGVRRTCRRAGLL